LKLLKNPGDIRPANIRASGCDGNTWQYGRKLSALRFDAFLLAGSDPDVFLVLEKQFPLETQFQHHTPAFSND
jgi:hypothetical protein